MISHVPNPTIFGCRRQFPIRPAFAMSINKSQGQTFKRVGIFLPNPCFTHGQLYVALSRVGDPTCIRVLNTHPAPHVRAPAPTGMYTSNFVFQEVFQRTRNVTATPHPPALHEGPHTPANWVHPTVPATIQAPAPTADPPVRPQPAPQLQRRWPHRVIRPGRQGFTISFLMVPLLAEAQGVQIPRHWYPDEGHYPPEWQQWQRVVQATLQWVDPVSVQAIHQQLTAQHYVHADLQDAVIDALEEHHPASYNTLQHFATAVFMGQRGH